MSAATERAAFVARVAAARVRSFSVLRRKGSVLSPMPTHEVTYRWGVKSRAYRAGHHTGEDYSTHGKTGIPVYAVTWGRVVESHGGGGSWGPAYGSIVVVEFTTWRGKTYRYAYCHLSWRDVSVGAKVQPGDRVGQSGNTGNSTGPHLHFEARRSPFNYGTDVDPMLVKTKPR